MRKGQLLFLFFATFSILYAHTHANLGEFELEKGLVEKLYRKSEQTASSSRSIFAIGPSVSFLSIDKLSLNGQYFSTDFALLTTAVPPVTISAFFQLLDANPFRLNLEISAGYSLRSGIQPTRNSAGLLTRDQAQLHWVPLLVSLIGEYRLTAVPFLIPTLRVGSGVQWLSQTGRLDGFSQSFWIPCIAGGVGVKLFDSVDAESWFGGLTVGVSLGRGVASQHDISFWGVDTGVRFYL